LQVLPFVQEVWNKVPWWALVIIAVALVALSIVRIREVRNDLLKLLTMARNYVRVDYGVRRLGALLLVSAFVSFPSARKMSDEGHIPFLRVFLLVVAAVFLFNLVTGSPILRTLFAPSAGTRWRRNRKVQTAGVINRITLLTGSDRLTRADVQDMVSDILSLIVSHVRDHRGSHQEDEYDVFANLLLPDGADLVVVARDRALRSKDYSRPVPKRYPTAALLCGEAIAKRQVLSVGDIHRERLGTPRDKPYNSVLAVPIERADGSGMLGVLSVDSTRPYFFKTFTPNALEDRLENNLQPYVRMLSLVLEGLAPRLPGSLLAVFDAQPGTEGSHAQ
jgi:hypothetical protein